MEVADSKPKVQRALTSLYPWISTLSAARVKRPHRAPREDFPSVWSFVLCVRLCRCCSCSSAALVITEHLVFWLFAAGSSATAAWDWGRPTRASRRLSTLFLTNSYQKWFRCRSLFGRWKQVCCSSGARVFNLSPLTWNTFACVCVFFFSFSSRKEVLSLQCRWRTSMGPLRKMTVTCFSLKRWYDKLV